MTDLTFQYANECDLEIHCSPFGLSGLYIKINGSNIMGIGSTMGLITGNTSGLLYYNDSNDLVDKKFKLYVVVDDEGFLRIDFTRIFTKNEDEKSLQHSHQPGSDASGSGEPVGGPETPGASATTAHDSNDEMPSLILRAKCPPGNPDNIGPFIGIFLFETNE